MISGFTEDYEFLHGSQRLDCHIDSVCYPSIDHAIQAYKTKNLTLRRKIKASEKPQTLLVKIDNPLYPQVIERIVEGFLLSKFRGKESLLKSTKPHYLMNSYDAIDSYWGVVGTENVNGLNRFGSLLMKIRREFR